MFNLLSHITQQNSNGKGQFSEKYFETPIQKPNRRPNEIPNGRPNGSSNGRPNGRPNGSSNGRQNRRPNVSSNANPNKTPNKKNDNNVRQNKKLNDRNRNRNKNTTQVNSIIQNYDCIYSIIPLNIFQTWCTLDLPPRMKENMVSLKNKNPEFKHYLYDDDMCRKFITDNFDEEILYTYNKLKPGAFKADLWRYCILYKYGGIYIDIKYDCCNEFKLIQLTNKEYYVRDRIINGIDAGIYNAFIVSLPYNNKLLKSIYNIVENVKNIYYYQNNNYILDSLNITGPMLLTQQFNISELDNLILSFSECGNYIKLQNHNILKKYKAYDIEKKYNNREYYTILYKNYDIYNFLYLTPINKINLSRTITKNINNIEVIFYSSNPCIIKDPLDSNKYIINIRWVNYQYDMQQESTLFVYPKTISLNSYYKIDYSFNTISEEIFLSEQQDYNEPYNMFGFEDIRLFSYSDKIYYIASKLNYHQKNISISSDKVELTDNSYILYEKFIQPNFKPINRIEKNWCFFNYKNDICLVYDWYPLTICRIDYDNNMLNIIEHKYINTDFFKNVKGSSSGVIFNNEIWFLLHISQNRNYQHFFAIFDLDMNLSRYSEPFKLDDSNCKIEYCIGLIIEDNRTILTFSTLDNYIYITTYDNDYIKSIKWYKH